jgi:sec-independent protein translocase protein TatA
MFIPQGPELLLIVLVIMLIFGGKKIPELMGGLGKGIKSFKKAMNEPESIDVTPEKREEIDTKSQEGQKKES